MTSRSPPSAQQQPAAAQTPVQQNRSQLPPAKNQAGALQALTTLQAMLNCTLTHIPTLINDREKRISLPVILESHNRYMDALDRLENELQHSQSVLRRDYAEFQAVRKRKRDEEAEAERKKQAQAQQARQQQQMRASAGQQNGNSSATASEARPAKAQKQNNPVDSKASKSGGAAAAGPIAQPAPSRPAMPVAPMATSATPPRPSSSTAAPSQTSKPPQTTVQTKPPPAPTTTAAPPLPDTMLQSMDPASANPIPEINFDTLFADITGGGDLTQGDANGGSTLSALSGRPTATGPSTTHTGAMVAADMDPLGAFTDAHLLPGLENYANMPEPSTSGNNAAGGIAPPDAPPPSAGLDFSILELPGAPAGPGVGSLGAGAAPPGSGPAASQGQGAAAAMGAASDADGFAGDAPQTIDFGPDSLEDLFNFDGAGGFGEGGEGGEFDSWMQMGD